MQKLLEVLDKLTPYKKSSRIVIVPTDDSITSPLEEREYKMSLVTPDILLEFAPRLGNKAITLSNVLNESSVITTELRLAHFLAQVGHESNYFNSTVENLNYSDEGLANTWPNRYSSGYDKVTKRYIPNYLAKSLHRKPEAIANVTYAGRMGNGDVHSGDGWKYRGRGYIQLTGRYNYTQYSLDVHGDYSVVDNPDWVAEPEDAIKSSLWYWGRNSLNVYADKDDVWAVSRAINIGNPNSKSTPVGIDDRINKLRKIKQILSI